MNPNQEFQFEGQAEEQVSKYIAANTVEVVEVKSVEYNESYNRIVINVENEKEQAGKADFSLSDNAFKYALTFVASLANKGGVGAKMAQEFPGGKCEGCERSEWVTKVGNAITGAKVSMLFGGKQNNGKWYAQAHLFGGVSTPDEAGVAELEARRQSLQGNDKFMTAEKVVEQTTASVTW